MSKTSVNLCHEQVKTLADKTGETAHVGVREGKRAFLPLQGYTPRTIALDDREYRKEVRCVGISAPVTRFPTGRYAAKEVSRSVNA